MSSRRSASLAFAAIAAMASLTCATQPEPPGLSETAADLALNYDYYDTDGYGPDAFLVGGCLSYAAAGRRCDAAAAFPDAGFFGGDYCTGNTLHEYFSTNSTFAALGTPCAANACCSNYGDWPVDCNSACTARVSTTGIALSFSGTCGADPNVTCPDTSHPSKCACSDYSFTDSDGGEAPFVAGAWGKFQSSTCGGAIATYRADRCASGSTLVEQVATGCGTTLPIEKSLSCEDLCPVHATGRCVAKDITVFGQTITSAECECAGATLDEQDHGDKPFEAGCMGDFDNATCAGQVSSTHWDRCIDPWRLIEFYRPGGGAGCIDGAFTTSKTYNCDTECKTLNNTSWSGRCAAEDKDCFGTVRTMGKCVCDPPQPPGSDGGMDSGAPDAQLPDAGFPDAGPGADAWLGDASPFG